MKTKRTGISLNMQGVDDAAAAVETWLTEAGVKRSDVLRTRLTVEELLITICEKGGTAEEAELRFGKRFGKGRLTICWGGGRFDPVSASQDGLEAVSAEMLSRIGLAPEYRRRGNNNELRLSVTTPGLRPELGMLLCFAAAVAVGLLGRFLPEAVRTGVIDYALRFLSGAFLNLLNTFIGIMIFLSITTGICGIGSAAAFGRVGKLILSRYVGIAFFLSALMTVALRFLFPLGGGDVGGGNPAMSVLETLFAILPSNPIRPFLEGNMIQIVFMGVFLGVGLLAVGGETESLRRAIGQTQKVIMYCVSLVCALLPLYIFSSLVTQFWTTGSDVFVQLWRPILICAVLSVLAMLAYLAVACRTLRVKFSVLLPKLMPPFLIALTTASSSAAFSTAMEIDEKKLGIDPAYARTAASMGCTICAGSAPVFYLIPIVYMAERCGIHANTAWWIGLWFMSTMVTMATPPVAGGTIACLSLLMAQMGIPQESMAAAVTLIMFLDFICTGTRVLEMHVEIALQANRLGMLNKEILRAK